MRFCLSYVLSRLTRWTRQSWRSIVLMVPIPRALVVTRFVFPLLYPHKLLVLGISLTSFGETWERNPNLIKLLYPKWNVMSSDVVWWRNVETAVMSHNVLECSVEGGCKLLKINKCSDCSCFHGITTYFPWGKGRQGKNEQNLPLIYLWVVIL